MKILAADTSTKITSVAILDGQETKAQINQIYSRSQGSALISIINKLFEKIDYDITQIELFCAGLGPGSFTGLRTSLATMRTLSMAFKKPIIGISSLDAIAYNLVQSSKFRVQSSDICVIFDARQNKVYSRFYRQRMNSIEPTSDFLLDNLGNILSAIEKQTVVVGDAIATYGSEILGQKKDFVSFMPEDRWYPKAEILAKIALEKYEKGHRDNPFSLLPLYLYPKECQVKTSKK